MLKMMLKQKVRGSISILLIIVMMPMMAVASIIVDASGYELSKSMVSSASDLTMNTALSYYDEILQEIYGIFGVSTTDAELQANLKTYFVDSLVANGVIDSEEEYKNSQMLQSIGNVFSGNVGEIIDIDVSADSSVTLSGLNGTELSQPEVLKTQIVEFMKYRTPVYGTMTLLDGLGSLRKVSEQSKVTKAQAEVTEAMGDFNDSCESAYKAIMRALNYYDENEQVFSWNNEYRKKDYEYIDKVVKYLCENSIQGQSFNVKYKQSTNDIRDAALTKLSNKLSKFNGQFVFNATIVYGEVSLDDKYTLTKKTTLSSEEKENSSSNMSQIIEKYSLSKGTWNEMQRLVDGNLAYCPTADDISQVNYFIRLFNGMENDVKKVEAYYDYLCDNDENTAKDDKIYDDFMTQIYRYSEMARMFTYQLNKEKEYANQLCKEINKEISEKMDKVKEYFDLINKAESKVWDICGILNDLDRKNEAFKKAIVEYDGSEKSDSFSNGMMQEALYNEESFDYIVVSGLAIRLGEMEEYVIELIAKIEEITYCGEMIYDIDSLDKAHNAYKNNKGAYVVPQYKVKSDIGYIDEDEYTFWRYLRKVFKDVDIKDDTPNQKNASEIVNDASSNSQSALSKENNISIGTLVNDDAKNKLPSAQYQAEQSSKVDVNKISIGGGSGKAGKYKGFSKMLDNVSTVVSSLFTKEGVTKALKGARDNLYVTDYTFQMFSYYTFEQEHKEEAERKTITGKRINAKNNQLYGAEIEYIIFGGDGNSSVDSSLNYIFAIRFMCNSVYAVTSGSIDAYTVPPAMAIQAATGGIVPYKLPEIVFEMALALAETFVDMDNLKKGEQVPLFKNTDTWSISLKGAVELTADAVKNVVTTSVGNASENLTSSFNDVVDKAGTMVTSNVENWTKDLRKNISGSVHDGVSALVSKVNISLVDEIEAVLKDVNDEVKTITSDTIMNNAWARVESYINGLGSNDIIYKIASNDAVKGKLKSYMFAYKPQLDDVLNKLKSNTDGAYTAVRDIEKNIADAITNQIDEILKSCGDQITGVVNEVTNAYQNRLKSEFGNSTEVAADKVIEITNNFIDESASTMISKLGISDTVVGNGSVKQNSLLTFGYADYLKMFLFLKLSTNSNAVMCRIGDVIQMNMGLQSGAKEKYLLSDRYTYVQLNVNVRYNTLFLSDDWFENISGEKRTGMDITYYGVRGY